MRILFCGDCFPASQSLLKERLPIGEDEIVVCNAAATNIERLRRTEPPLNRAA